MTIFGTRLFVAMAAASLAVVAVSGDVQAQRGRNRAPASGLPQVACAAGVPQATPFASAAQDALNRTLIARENTRTGFFNTAAEQARQGVAAGETNPYHHFLLGRAQMGLGNYAAADSALRRTLELCPEFADEVREERRKAYATLFTEGMEAFTANDTTTALARWEAAGAVFNESPDPFFNAGVLLAERGQSRPAVAHYRAALAAAERSTDSTTAAEVLDLKGRTLLALSNLGLTAFQADSFALADSVLSYVLAGNPNDRNAMQIQAFSLYKMERWAELVPSAQRLLTADPLNYNAYLLIFNAQKTLAERANAASNAALERQLRSQMVSTLGRADSLPVQLETIRQMEGNLVGEVAHGAAAAGTPVNLEFTLFGLAGPVGTQRVTVAAPAEGAKATFQVAIPVVGTEPAVLLGYRYRVVP